MRRQFTGHVLQLISLCNTNFQFLDGYAKTTTRQNTAFLSCRLKKVTRYGV